MDLCSHLGPLTVGCPSAIVAANATAHGIVRGRLPGGAREEELQGQPSSHDGRGAQRRCEEGFEHYPPNSPANPMKQIESSPAKMRESAVPLTISGMEDSSIFSRSPAISTNARVNPVPAPNA